MLNYINEITVSEAIRKRPELYFGKNHEMIPLIILREALCIPRSYAREGKATFLRIHMHNSWSENVWIDIFFDASIPACEKVEGTNKTLAEVWFEDALGCKDSKAPEHKDLCQLGLISLTAMSKK